MSIKREITHLLPLTVPYILKLDHLLFLSWRNTSCIKKCWPAFFPYWLINQHQNKASDVLLDYDGPPTFSISFSISILTVVTVVRTVKEGSFPTFSLLEAVSPDPQH